MDKIIDKKWDYTLYKKEDELILSAVCGSVGIFEINVVLTPSEIEEYNQQGEEYIETLARKIQRTPSGYKSRHIEIPAPARADLQSVRKANRKGNNRNK